MRANKEHTTDSNTSKWHSSLGYNKSIENIEIVISEKLEITLLEAKKMVNSKKGSMTLESKDCLNQENKKQTMKKEKNV